MMTEKLPRILVAEDNPNDIELAMAAFDESGLIDQVDIVHNGIEALDYLFCRNKYAAREPVSPAFVLLDIQMPGLDGIEVLKEIRNSPDIKNLPVVMLTSSNIESDVLNCYMLGANGYVVKPINFDDFVNTIKGISVFWATINTSPCKI